MSDGQAVQPTVAVLPFKDGDFVRLTEHYFAGKQALAKGTVLHVHAIMPSYILACVEDVRGIEVPTGIGHCVTDGTVHVILPASLERVRSVQVWEACP